MVRSRVPFDDGPALGRRGGTTRRGLATQRYWKDVPHQCVLPLHTQSSVKLYFDREGKLCGRVAPTDWGLWYATLCGNYSTGGEAPLGKYESIDHAVAAVNAHYEKIDIGSQFR